MAEAQVIGMTGARGVLGRITAKLADDMGLTVNAFPGDVTAPQDVQQWLQTTRCDAILHFAALVPVSEVEAEPARAMEINAGGTELLIKTLQDLNQSPWFLYASTSHVYCPSSAPLSETDLLDPVSTYGKTKLEGEKACLAASDTLRICIGRIFSYFHAEQLKPFLYPSIKARLETEDLSEPFELHGAQSTRDFLPAEAVAEIILKLCQRREKGVFNIASGKARTIAEFVQSLTSQKLDIIAKGPTNHLVADISKLSKVLCE